MAIEVDVKGTPMKFITTGKLFSPNAIDIGTRAMLSCLSFNAQDKVLDLGCGYGVVGIYAAKLIGDENVTMVDIDADAISIAKENALINGVAGIRAIQSNGFESIDDTGYTFIISNPPYHSDFKTAKHFIEKGFNRLAIGGKMVMVTKRKEWYRNKMNAIFGGVTMKEIDQYFILIFLERVDKKSA